MVREWSCAPRTRALGERRPSTASRRLRGDVPRRRLVRDASAPRIWRSTPRISVRILDCHSRTRSFGSFFLNIAMKPMASVARQRPRAAFWRGSEVTFALSASASRGMVCPSDSFARFSSSLAESQNSGWRTRRGRGIQSRASHARVFRSTDVSERHRGPEGTQSRLRPRFGRAPARAAQP